MITADNVDIISVDFLQTSLLREPIGVIGCLLEDVLSALTPSLHHLESNWASTESENRFLNTIKTVQLCIQCWRRILWRDGPPAHLY